MEVMELKSMEVIWSAALGSNRLLCTGSLLASISSIFSLTWSSLEEEEDNSDEEEKDFHDCQLLVG